MLLDSLRESCEELLGLVMDRLDTGSLSGWCLEHTRSFLPGAGTIIAAMSISSEDMMVGFEIGWLEKDICMGDFV